jgi:cellulose synthase/poly-beta-1,6-N-acetylglucosamine synthase-like glycosyltransferase
MGLLAAAAPLIALIYAGWQARNYHFWRKSLRKQNVGTNNLPTVAIIVPFRNEAATIGKLIDDLKAQDYPRDRYSIILVDDHSEDGGAPIAIGAGANLTGTDRLLQLANHPEAATTVAHKKAALTLGIRDANTEIIVTTDADCRWSPGTLRRIASAFEPATDMVLGPVLIDRVDDVCSALQALDLLGYQLFTAASVAAGTPALANGACLAFRRKTFLELGGYAGVDHLPSGDDVLLLHKFVAAGHRNVRYLGDPAAAVTTRPVAGWVAFWRQRLRWAGKAGSYVNSLLQLAQALAFATSVAILGSLLLTALDRNFLWAGLLAWAIKAVADGILLQSACHHFGRGRWMQSYPVSQLIYPFYLVGIGTAALLGVKTEWKGRST